MLNRIKTSIGKFFVGQLENRGLTVVKTGVPRIKNGDWFSIKKIVRCPQDGSWRGDLFRADKVEGAFIAATRFDAHSGRGQKHSMHAPDYELQTLSTAYVLTLRPELNAVAT